MASSRWCLVAALIVSVADGAALSATARSHEEALESTWLHELQAPNPETKIVEYKSPVQRVVSLLRKMKAELDAEAEKESEMYDQMVCWCQTNEKEKVKAIADADAKEIDLQSEIESRSARFGELATEIEHLKGQIAEDSEALKEATSIREGDAGEFRDEEKELVQAINNLRNAIAILSKHHGGSSLLQLDAPTLSTVRLVLRDAALKYEVMLGDSPRAGEAATGRVRAALLATGAKTERLGKAARQSSAQMHSLLRALDTRSPTMADTLPLWLAERRVAELAAPPADEAAALLQEAKQPAGAGESYTPQSGVIFGILKQMKEEFEAKLTTFQEEDAKSKEDYEGMSGAKADQLTVAKEKLDAMEGEHAENEKALSDAKEDLELTRKQRSADVEFLRNLRLTCQGLDKEWELRSKARSDEIKAVAETLVILTQDDTEETPGREMLAKGVALVQTSASTAMRVVRSRAAAALRRAAWAPAFDADDLLSAWRGRGRRTGVALGAVVGPRAQLSTLAMSVQLDAFTKVKAAMDKMVEELKSEQTEEVAFKASCEKRFGENEKATYTKTEEKEDLQRHIEKLATLVKTLTEEIEAAKQQVADTEIEIKKASGNREEENAQFQTTVADQRAVQEILTKALARLKAFYKKGGGGKVVTEEAEGQEAALVQQTPPVQFTKLKKNSGASPVMGLIEQIIEDSKKLESDAVATETESQADYEKFVKDSNALIAELTEAISKKTEAIATATVESEQAQDDLRSAEGELEALSEVLADLHGECDFVIKNFSIRQSARLQEIEAIQSAKGILSGAASL